LPGNFKLPDEDFLILLAQAYQVRRKYFGKIVHIQVLRNARAVFVPKTVIIVRNRGFPMLKSIVFH